MIGKTIILLVGPKGSGKTYLASRMEEELGVGFVRVEPIWLALAEEIRPGSASFDDEGQARVLTAVKAALADHSAVCLESTGTAPWLRRQLTDLEAICDLNLIKVEAPLSLCLDRVRRRDAALHIPVSDARVAEINDIAGQGRFALANERLERRCRARGRVLALLAGRTRPLCLKRVGDI